MFVCYLTRSNWCHLRSEYLKFSFPEEMKLSRKECQGPGPHQQKPIWAWTATSVLSPLPWGSIQLQQGAIDIVYNYISKTTSAWERPDIHTQGWKLRAGSAGLNQPQSYFLGTRRFWPERTPLELTGFIGISVS